MNPNALSRELRADESGLLLTHLLALEPEARRLRFANANTSDEHLRQYVEGIDFSNDAVFVVSNAELAIVGAGHLARSGEQAELGISVLAEARGQGIGAALLERCAARARNWGVRVLFMNCLVENKAMLHLAHKQGLQVAVSSGEAEAFVQLPRANLGSLAAEAIAEHLGLFDQALKSHWQSLRGLWQGTAARADADEAAPAAVAASTPKPDETA